MNPTTTLVKVAFGACLILARPKLRHLTCRFYEQESFRVVALLFFALLVSLDFQTALIIAVVFLGIFDAAGSDRCDCMMQGMGCRLYTAGRVPAEEVF